MKRHGQPVTLAACWAHARRKFFEAAQTGAHKADALLIVHMIKGLYAVEKKLRESGASPKLRCNQRQLESRPIIERLRARLESWIKRRRHLPSSQMARAIDYTLTLWADLCVYLEDGRIEPERSGDSQPSAARRASAARQIDNNLVEPERSGDRQPSGCPAGVSNANQNAIRPTAVGKKNWLFIGDAHAGERSAIIFTVIEACRSRGIDPFEYLRDVFTRMPTLAAKDYPTLTPEAWQKARRSKASAPAQRKPEPVILEADLAA